MNNDRRKEISRIIEEIDSAVSTAKEKLEELQSSIESVRDEEQECMDNIPENLQGSERYETAEQAVDNLDSAVSSIEELIEAIDTDDLIEHLNDAAE